MAAFNATQHALNVQGTYVAEMIKNNKVGKWDLSNLGTAWSKESGHGQREGHGRTMEVVTY